MKAPSAWVLFLRNRMPEALMWAEEGTVDGTPEIDPVSGKYNDDWDEGFPCEENDHQRQFRDAVQLCSGWYREQKDLGVVEAATPRKKRTLRASGNGAPLWQQPSSTGLSPDARRQRFSALIQDYLQELKK